MDVGTSLREEEGNTRSDSSGSSYSTKQEGRRREMEKRIIWIVAKGGEGE